MLRGELKTEELDELFARLLRGLTPKAIGLVAARKQESLIRESYTDRWRDALGGDITAGYRAWKQEVGASEEPGILTGSTLRALTSDADDEEGKVYLEGDWPNTEGKPTATVLSRMELSYGEIKEYQSAPLFYDESGVNTPWGFISSEPFSSKKFGTRRSTNTSNWGRGSQEIHWLYPGAGDEPLIADSVEQLVNFLIDPSAGAPESLAEVFGL